MLLCLVARVLSYIELTADNCESIIGGPNHAFVKFYSPDCPFCKALADEFEEAATAYSTVSFAGVNCDAQADVCAKYGVSGHPVLKLYLKESSEGILFEDHIRTVQTFCDFIDNHTGIKGNRPIRSFHQLTPGNFDNVLSVNRCLFVTFYTSWCAGSKKFLPQVRIVGHALVAEPNVTIGGVNCETYKDLCDTYRVVSFPGIKLFKEGTIRDYPGDKTAEATLDYINTQCATNREITGLLGPTAGLIPEAQDLIGNFLSADDKRAVIGRMKQIPKSDFYVKVMERFLSSGPEQIEADKRNMMEIMRERKGSWASIDWMKQRYNIFAQFLPKEDPQPEPTPGDDEDEPILVANPDL
jgi:thioredoxin-like negative regulator of GroEL